MEDWKNNRSWAVGFLGLPTVWLTVLFTLPLVVVWVYSFGYRGALGETIIGFTLANYIRSFELIHLAILWKSAWIAIVVTVICFVIGFPMAMAVAFAPSRYKNIFLLIVILPFWTNLLIRTYAWIAVLRPRGFLNSGLEWLHEKLGFILDAAGLPWGEFVPLEILYNDTAVVIGLIYVHLPFMILPIYATLEKLERSYLEAALDLGASQLRTILQVMMPLSLPGIVTGCMLVFILTLGNFVVPDVLGGTSSLMIGNQIARQFGAARDWPFGSALSFVVLYATFLLLWLKAVYTARSAERNARSW